MSKEQAKDKEARIKMLECLKAKGIDKTILEMEKEIKEAIKAGISRNSLDKGRYCGQIIDGKKVSEYHIVRIYTNLIALQSGNNPIPQKKVAKVCDNNKQGNKLIEREVCYNNKQSNKPIEQVHIVDTTLKSMRLTIDSVVEENKALRKELEAVKAELETVKKVCDNNKQGNKPDECNVCDNNKPVTNEPKIMVLGFTLKEETTLSKGHVYKNWFAKKMIAGKLHRIFVGKDRELAETKIKTYCLNKAIELEPSKS